MELVIEVFKKEEERDAYIASCPKLDVYGCGKSIEEAIYRLKKILNFYVESADELGISLEELCNASKNVSFNFTSNKEAKEDKIYLN
ncbi:hypothetical protein KJ849_02955 [bacterium]|nr:hypothetical protein [bacterium]